MLRYFGRRVLLAIPVLIGVATLVFSLIHLVPGDPAQALLHTVASPSPEPTVTTRQPADLSNATAAGSPPVACGSSLRRVAEHARADR